MHNAIYSLVLTPPSFFSFRHSPAFKEELQLGSLPPFNEKKKKCLPAIAMWPTFHPHIGPFLFHPSLPNGRVATAGECKCHPVLPVNYTTTKLIVCLVHTRKMPRSAIDGSIVSAQMQRFLFSQSRLNTD